MDTTNQASERARWQVLWLHEGRKHVVRCGDDFSRAMKVYTMAVEGGRSNVTLRCQNMGFPPPEKYRPHPELDQRGNPTGATVVPMQTLNDHGIWWCPYCVKLRRFKYTKGWYTETGYFMAEPQMTCPLCGVKHTDFWVKHHNPKGAMMANGHLSVRTEKPKRRRRRRRTT